MLLRNLLCIVFLSLALWSCKEEVKKNNGNGKTTPIQLDAPEFNADSAYVYIQKQVDFGPRVPGSDAHKTTADWLTAKLSSFTDSAFVQEANTTLYDGTPIPIYNIIAQFNPEKSDRVLLSAHWDTRRVAEKDLDPNKKNEPIDGANDGGSGVGVLIEIARQLQATNTDLGVDIILFDAEDNGISSTQEQDTWCLGAQHWAQNPHVENYKAKYGILLDMVGADNAIFKYEMQAYQKAAPLYLKTWNMAHNFGHADRFLKAAGGAITDDHVYVMQYRNFPMIDIIDYDPQRKTGFGEYHHTHQDNMDVISKSTLKAVGETVLGVLKY